MELSLCITTFNRFQYLRESFEQVIHHDRIGEIILMDDCSDMKVFKQIEGLQVISPKIKVYRQAVNRGMGRNKADAISYAQNPWCILFDSDNIITPAYVDAIPLANIPTMIYQPSFAKPAFDFRKYIKQGVNYVSARSLIYEPMFNTMLNACNYVVNRDKYLQVYQDNPAQKGADTIWMSYLWLKAGYYIYITEGLEYFHRVHDGSGFMADIDHNMKKAEEVKKLILAL